MKTHSSAAGGADGAMTAAARWTVLYCGVDTRDLADMVPALMARHATHTWILTSGQQGAEDLILEVRPRVAPEREARVQVFRGAEVYFMDFAGHSSSDFAYDEDQPEALQRRIDLAVLATLGPTRVVLDRDGEVIVRSVMVIDPDGPHRKQDTIVTRPIPFLAARIGRRQVTREVLEFAAIDR